MTRALSEFLCFFLVVCIIARTRQLDSLMDCQEKPGGARRSQEEPGRTRKGQEGPGGASRNQE